MSEVRTGGSVIKSHAQEFTPSMRRRCALSGLSSSLSDEAQAPESNDQSHVQSFELYSRLVA